MMLEDMTLDAIRFRRLAPVGEVAGAISDRGLQRQAKAQQSVLESGCGVAIQRNRRRRL